VAHDLSREGLEARKRREQAEATTQAVQQAAEMPEQVIYANAAKVDVQADGSVVLSFGYDSPAGHRSLADVILPPAAFANIAGPAHAVMQAAAQQLSMVTDTINRAVADRTARLGDTSGPGEQSRDAIRRARREQAGD
jgi:hypothetical protein